MHKVLLSHYRLHLGLSFSLVLISLGGFAQDIIYKHDGTKLEAKIIEVSPEHVKYKRFDNLAGPDYILKSSEITVIAYENGSHDTFKSPAVVSTSSHSRKSRKWGALESYYNNLVGFNMGPLLIGRVEFSYQRLLADGKLGLHVPLRFGLGEPQTGRELIYSVGVGTRFYPMGQKKISFFFGPGMEVGQIESQEWLWWGDEAGAFHDYVAIYMNNGILFHPHKNLNFSTGMGFGLRNEIQGNSSIIGKFEMSAIYSFGK